MSITRPQVACIGEFTGVYDDAWWRAVVLQRELSRRLPTIQFTWFSWVLKSSGSASFGTIHPVEKAHALAQHSPDAVIVTGQIRLGPSVGGRTGNLAPWLAPFFLAAKWNTPILWDAVRFVGRPEPEQVPFVQLADQIAVYRSVADCQSRERLRGMGATGPIEVVPDPRVVLGDVVEEAEIESAWKRFLNHLPEPKTPTLGLQLDERVLQEHAEILARTLQELTRSHFHRVLLVPRNRQSGHRLALETLAGRLNGQAVILNCPHSLHDLVALIGGMDAWIGSSLPGCLAALCQHKPFLALRSPGGQGRQADLFGHRLLPVDRIGLHSALTPWLLASQREDVARLHRQQSEQAGHHLDHIAERIQAGASRSGQAPVLSTSLLWPLVTYACPSNPSHAAKTRSVQPELHRRLRKAQRELRRLRQYYGQPRFSWVERLHRIGRAPMVASLLGLVAPAVRHVIDALWNWRGTQNPLARALNHVLFMDTPLRWLCKQDVTQLLQSHLGRELRELFRGGVRLNATRWFKQYRPKPDLLDQLRQQVWPDYAPSFTILVQPQSNRPEWLRDSLRSVQRQTYPKWEALLLHELPPGIPDQDDRIRHVPGSAQSVLPACRGDYVCLLDHGDTLEPQALQRFAEVILQEDADLLYSDAVVTGMDLDDIHTVCARPAFSYDYFLAHGYFDHLVGVRTDRLRQAGGFGDDVGPDRNTDWILRILENANKVSHVPEVLYRRRESDPGQPASGSQQHRQAVVAHLRRLGLSAQVADTDHPACCDVRWQADACRTAVVIPTKNRHDLLRMCINSLEKTVAGNQIELCIVDHESTEPATRDYLQMLEGRGSVLPYQGPFNYSRMMNHAVARLGSRCDFFLFLNNDVEALKPGWLDHMLAIGQRRDVGAVGALLLYGDRTVQHAGAMVGMSLAADHVFKHKQAFTARGKRRPGRDMVLLGTRDQSIVTGACLLVRAEVFHDVGGFDPGFVVGFGDTDLCLRIRARGYKVILDAQAVLLHHESATRGKSPEGDPHPLDTQRFRSRYLSLILEGDPCYSPLLSRQNHHDLNPFACVRAETPSRTVTVVLPAAATQADLPRLSRAA